MEESAYKEKIKHMSYMLLNTRNRLSPGDFMPVLQDRISEIIPSHKCDMNRNPTSTFKKPWLFEINDGLKRHITLC
jgi:hypothetical protein